MEDASPLSNFLAQGAIVLFLAFVLFFVLRTLMLPLGVLFLSAIRGRRQSSSDVEDKTQPSVPPTPE